MCFHSDSVDFRSIPVFLGHLRSFLVITFCVSRTRSKMYCGHVHLSVCLSAAACPHYCTDPDVTWGSSRGCPLVVHYWADLQHNANPSYKLVFILRYDDIVRLHGRLCTHCWRVTGAFSKIVRRICEVGVAGWPLTGAFSTLLRQCGLRASNGGFWQNNANAKC